MIKINDSLKSFILASALGIGLAAGAIETTKLIKAVLPRNPETNYGRFIKFVDNDLVQLEYQCKQEEAKRSMNMSPFYSALPDITRVHFELFKAAKITISAKPDAKNENMSNNSNNNLSFEKNLEVYVNYPFLEQKYYLSKAKYCEGTIHILGKKENGLGKIFIREQPNGIKIVGIDANEDSSIDTLKLYNSDNILLKTEIQGEELKFIEGLYKQL